MLSPSDGRGSCRNSDPEIVLFEAFLLGVVPDNKIVVHHSDPPSRSFVHDLKIVAPGRKQRIREANVSKAVNFADRVVEHWLVQPRRPGEQRVPSFNHPNRPRRTSNPHQSGAVATPNYGGKAAARPLGAAGEIVLRASRPTPQPQQRQVGTGVVAFAASRVANL